MLLARVGRRERQIAVTRLEPGVAVSVLPEVRHRAPVNKGGEWVASVRSRVRVGGIGQEKWVSPGVPGASGPYSATKTPTPGNVSIMPLIRSTCMARSITGSVTP